MADWNALGVVDRGISHDSSVVLGTAFDYPSNCCSVAGHEKRQLLTGAVSPIFLEYLITVCSGFKACWSKRRLGSTDQCYKVRKMCCKRRVHCDLPQKDDQDLVITKEDDEVYYSESNTLQERWQRNLWRDRKICRINSENGATGPWL